MVPYLLGLDKDNLQAQSVLSFLLVRSLKIKYLIDGLDLDFQLTPGTEAPAEMNTYIPTYQALWMAENCTCTMHNLYTLRGAQIRDGKSWSRYLIEAQRRYGPKAKVLFHAHTWPRYATEEEPAAINRYLLDQARLYKGIHDESLKAVNAGYTINELAEPERLLIIARRFIKSISVGMIQIR